MVLNENISRKIIPIAGGKGGVGKSVFATNLALSLALYGKKTIVIDLDLGGSNIHTLLGERNTNPGIGNYLSGSKFSMQQMLCPTQWDNLQYIPGDVLVYGVGDLSRVLKKKITAGMMELDADYIIVDLGAGTNFTVIDFFLISNSGIIVTTPKTTSIMNAYSFLKNYVYRFLQRAFNTNKEVSTLLKRILKERNPNSTNNVSTVIQAIADKNPSAAEKAEAFLDVLQPKLILNQISTMEEISMAKGLRDLCKNNLALNIECLGTLMNNSIVDQSINMLTPFVAGFPEEIITEEIHRISQKIMQSNHFPEMPLDLEYYEDSFELAQMETENDLAGLKQTGASHGSAADYDVDKLLELVQIQQSRIQKLQNTLRMISMEN